MLQTYASDAMLGFDDAMLGFDDAMLGFDDVVLCFDDVVLCFVRRRTSCFSLAIWLVFALRCATSCFAPSREVRSVG